MSNHPFPDPATDRVIQLEKLLPDLDDLNADDRMVVITLIRHTVPRLPLSRLLAHLQTSPDHARDCILRLIRRRAIRILDVDDPRTLICVSLSPLSNAAASDYRPGEPKWYPIVLVDDLPGLPPSYLNNCLSQN
jgi:hypothetical protein